MIAGLQSFPFHTLDALSRVEVAAAARLRRLARAHVRIEAILASLSELTGERLELRSWKLRRPAPTEPDGGVGIVLAPDGASPSERVLVEVDGAFATAIVSRALKLRVPRVTDITRAASPQLVGAIAAIVSAVVREAHGESPLRVLSAGPSHDVSRTFLASQLATTAALTVLAGPNAFVWRVTVPHAATARAPVSTPDMRATLRSLGNAPLAIPIVAASVLASRDDLERLRPGDAFVAPGFALRGTTELTGPVALVAGSSEVGIGADLAEGRRLVVRGQLESHPLSSVESEASMPNEPKGSPMVDALEGVPVVLRVELGAVEMSARGWAELGPGDVVTLGRKLGDPAILRVGGVEVARGELVLVDDEYAVRILSHPEGATR